MKKYLLSALAIALIGATIASIAQSAPMDHSSHGTPGLGMMGMSDDETDAERQALMAERKKLMMEKHAQMMSSNTIGHDMNGMPGNMAEHQEMMHKRMGMMPM